MITIEEFKKKHSYKIRLIGLDLGSKRIGVSICDEKQSIATPFRTINKTNINDLINQLKKIIDELDTIIEMDSTFADAIATRAFSRFLLFNIKYEGLKIIPQF